MFDSLTSFFADRVDFADLSLYSIPFILVGIWFARFVTRRIVNRVIDRSLKAQHYTNKKERIQRRNTLTSVFSTIITVAYVVLGIVLVLASLNINLTATVAGLGALGVVVGIAGQSFFKEVLRGITILMYDQMRVDDIVSIAGVSGTVEAIALQYTRLRDLDGIVHVVPNGEITVVTNMSLNHANVNLDIVLDYNTDIAKVAKIMNKIGTELAEDKEYRDLIIEPIQFLRVDDFMPNGIEVKALGKVQPGEQWGIAGEYRRRLKLAFDAADVYFALPQTVLHQAKK